MAATGTADKRFPGQNVTIVQWAIDVLTGLGVPVTPTNIGIMVTWANAESGGYNPGAAGGRNNPLNTTQQGPGWIGGGGSQGNISDFATYQDGVRAQVTNLRNPRFGYPAILAGLQAQNPQQTFAAINASGFGTHFPSNYAGQGPTSAGGATATLTGFPNPLSPNPLNNPLVTGPFAGFLGNIPGISDIVGKITDPFKQLEVSLLSKLIYLGEILAGMAFITLGIIIVMVDTGALSKAPIPIPV